MDEDFDTRVIEIVTRTTGNVGLSPSADTLAKSRFLRRYQFAICEFLVKRTQSRDDALEVFQEFALKYLRGGLRSFDPKKGSFSVFIKEVLRNLVRDFHQIRRKKGGVLVGIDEVAEPAQVDDDPFKQQLIDEAWERLRQLEEDKTTPYYTVLRITSEAPEIRAAQIGEQISKSESSVRQILRRARQHFAGFLIDATASFVGSDSLTEVEDELKELKLMRYCVEVLAERRGVS